MQRSRIMLALAIAATATFTLSATGAEDAKSEGAKKEKETKIVCPVSGKEINKKFAAEYKKGKAYFCCANCPKAFAANTKKYATKANLQLVQTGQYVQKGCPVSGRDLNPEETVKIKNQKVGFCCPNCKGKVAELKGKKKLKAVFAEKPFKKAYKPKKKKDAA